MSAGNYADLLLGRKLIATGFDERFGSDWRPVEDVYALFCEEMRSSFLSFGYEVGALFDNNAVEYVSWLEDEKAFSVEGDDYTGFYYRLNITRKDQLVREFLTNQEQSKRILRLGDVALERTLDKLAKEGDWQATKDFASHLDTTITADMVPASDRIVTFSDNQISDLDGKVTSVIDAVTGQNQINDIPGTRELVLGQLKASRELIRAGSVRLYILEIALIRTLKTLAQRYEKEAIGALATALLSALAKYLGIDL